MSRFRRIIATAAATVVVAALLQAPEAALAAGPNLAAGKPFSASSSTDVYPAGNAGDGNPSTYWESNNNAFPQWLQVDLGSAVSVNQIVLKLPPAAPGQTRTQTLTVQGSTNGSSFTTLKASPPATPSTRPRQHGDDRLHRRHHPLRPGAPSPATPAGRPGSSPSSRSTGRPPGRHPGADRAGNLAYTQPATGQIRLTWNASTDNVGVTGYDVYANGSLRTSVAGNVLTYTDSQPATATVAYYVRAKDAAGNESATSNTVTRTGTQQPDRDQPGRRQADQGLLDGVHLRRHQRQRQQHGDLLGGQRVPGERSP